MPAHSRSKNGVLSHAYVAGIHVLNTVKFKDVDGRDKPGHDGVACQRQSTPLSAGIWLRNNIGRQLILDAPDLVAQDKFAFLQPLHLDQVGTRRNHQGFNRRIEIAVFLQQARQLLSQRAFFLVGHRHRWFACAWPLHAGRSPTIIAFSTDAFKVPKNRKQLKALRRFAAGMRQVYRRSCGDSALHLHRREPLIEETYCMSMQSHLAELEKKHQALEEEINECLTHPAVDDLKIVELKRRKLQVKDEIERLRINGSASVH
jgi:hypothetical protein